MSSKNYQNRTVLNQVITGIGRVAEGAVLLKHGVYYAVVELLNSTRYKTSRR